MPSISGGVGDGINDDASGVDGGDSKVCGICDTEPLPSIHDQAGGGGGIGMINGCFDQPLCQATLSSVDQITCGSVQSSMTPLEKLFRFRPSNMSDYFTRGGSGGSMQQNKEEEDNNGRRQATELMRMKERGGKAASYNGEAAPIGPTKCEYCAAESTMKCTSNLPQEYNALFMGSTTTTAATTICKGGVDLIDKNSKYGTSNAQVVAPVVVCHRPKLFFLKKRPPFATMDGWNPITEYRINLFEPPTTMEGMDRGWGEVRGHLGDKSSNNTNTTSSAAAGGGDFGYENNNNNTAADATDATFDKEGGMGGGSKSTIETSSMVHAGNKTLVIAINTNNIHDSSKGIEGGGSGGNGARSSSSSPLQWAWSGLMGVLTPKSSKDVIK